MLNKIRYYVWRWFSEKRMLRKENKNLKESLKKLELETEATILRKYLKTGSEDVISNVEQIVGDDALKHFGQMWEKHKADVMTVFTALEYEYINNYEFTEAEIKVFKHVVGNMGLFFRSCQTAYELKMELQALQNNAP